MEEGNAGQNSGKTKDTFANSESSDNSDKSDRSDKSSEDSEIVYEYLAAHEQSLIELRKLEQELYYADQSINKQNNS